MHTRSKYFFRVEIGVKNFWIRCTCWFNAGSRIIENNFRGCFLQIIAPVGGSNAAGPYPTNPLPNPAGHS